MQWNSRDHIEKCVMSNFYVISLSKFTYTKIFFSFLLTFVHVSPFLISIHINVSMCVWICMYVGLCVCVKIKMCIRGCIQKFLDWPPGARIANGTDLCHYVQLYRYLMWQSSEFCRHNPLCYFSVSVYCCLFCYRLSPETSGYTLVLPTQNMTCYKTGSRRTPHDKQKPQLPWL